MTLYHLLGHIEPAVPLMLFDISGNQICQVKSKEALNIDLYDYDVASISIGRCDLLGRYYAIYLTILK